MASRIYRKLSSSNFLKQSLSFHHQRSLTSSNLTSHKKLPSLNPAFAQILIKPYSHNPTPTRHNNPPDRSDYSQFFGKGRSNLTPKSLTSLLNPRNFQNPYGIHGNPRFLSTSNPNQKSENPETPSTENHEVKHQEITGPTKDREDLETMLKTVSRLSMISAGFALLNIGLEAWLSYNSPSFGVDIQGLLFFGIFLSLAYVTRRDLKAIKQGRLQVMAFKLNKNLFNNFVRLMGVSYVPLAAAMAALVYAEGFK